MTLRLKLTMLLGVLALAATPALALADPGNGNGPKYVPAGQQLPAPGELPEGAKAYGRYCKGESRAHVNGEKGTAFSRCVSAMAKAASHKRLGPGQVCKGKSKEHVKGEKGTEFSRCVTATARLRQDERRS